MENHVPIKSLYNSSFRAYVCNDTWSENGVRITFELLSKIENVSGFVVQK
jgi:hypothetical protein